MRMFLCFGRVGVAFLRDCEMCAKERVCVCLCACVPVARLAVVVAILMLLVVLLLLTVAVRKMYVCVV